MINNYTTNRQRFDFTNAKVNEKPHNTVINRIHQNQTVIHEGRKENASAVQERVKSIPEGKINREVRIDQPRVTNYIVPAGEMNRPKSEMKLQQREIKKRGKGGAETDPGGVGRPGPSSERSVHPGPPTQRQKRVAPAKPEHPEKPVEPGQPVERTDRKMR